MILRNCDPSGKTPPIHAHSYSPILNSKHDTLNQSSNRATFETVLLAPSGLRAASGLRSTQLWRRRDLLRLELSVRQESGVVKLSISMHSVEQTEWRTAYGSEVGTVYNCTTEADVLGFMPSSAG